MLRIEELIDLGFSDSDILLFFENSEEDLGDVSEFIPSSYWTDRIFELLQEKKIRYTINPETGLIDVDGSVYFSNCNLESFGKVGFGNVTGNFCCNNNQFLDLKGAPKAVGKQFNCSNNRLTTLEGGPRYIGEDFFCYNNYLTTLKGAPEFVGENFNCRDNYLTTLEGAPESVGESFNCNDNQLTTLKGAPKAVGKDVNCYRNQLITLEGAPQKVGGNINCFLNYITYKEVSKIRRSSSYQIKGKIHYVPTKNKIQESSEKNLGDVSEFLKPAVRITSYNDIMKTFLELDKKMEYAGQTDKFLFDLYNIYGITPKILADTFKITTAPGEKYEKYNCYTMPGYLNILRQKEQQFSKLFGPDYQEKALICKDTKPDIEEGLI